MQAIQSIFCSKKGNIAREINGCFLNKTSHIMVFMHKNKRFMHKCIRMHKKKTRESRCIISDVTRREREQKTPDWLKKWGINTCFFWLYIWSFWLSLHFKCGNVKIKKRVKRNRKTKIEILKRWNDCAIDQYGIWWFEDCNYWDVIRRIGRSGRIFFPKTVSV